MLSALPLVGLSVPIDYGLDFPEPSLSKYAGMVAVNISTLMYVGYKRFEHHLERRSYWYRVVSRGKDKMTEANWSCLLKSKARFLNKSCLILLVHEGYNFISAP